MVIDDKTYRDMIDISPIQFWELFDSLKEQPSTTAGNPGDFLGAFIKAGEKSDRILCILVSKVLTATFESAFQARKMARQQNPGMYDATGWIPR